MHYPTLELDYNYRYTSSHGDRRNFELLVDNVWHAQMAGCPKILTYNGPNLSSGQRAAAMRFDAGAGVEQIPRILSRDEYPFACTAEGGGASWVGHVPGHQNSVQGGKILAFLRQYNIAPGQRFIVKITNHPDGPVRNYCGNPKNNDPRPCPGCTLQFCIVLKRPMKL